MDCDEFYPAHSNPLVNEFSTIFLLAFYNSFMGDYFPV